MLLGATEIDRVRWLTRDIASFFDPALMLMKLLGFLYRIIPGMPTYRATILNAHLIYTPATLMRNGSITSM